MMMGPMAYYDDGTNSGTMAYYGDGTNSGTMAYYDELIVPITLR